MESIADPQIWLALATLTALEIVLGIDNIIFISIQAGKLPDHQQRRARLVGLGLAMLIRIALLFTLSWLMGLTAPIFSVLGMEISGRDLILISGGLFLLWKSTMEIHEKLEGVEEEASGRVTTSFATAIVQILMLDIVFSLDSIITAIGMANNLLVMITAVVLSVGFMMFFSGSISGFVKRHPTIKMLALSFLTLIGVTLIADGLDFHIPKGYIYFAMLFSVIVEMLNLRLRRKTAPVILHHRYQDENLGTDIAGKIPPEDRT